jgi:hypothetical protein
MIERQAIIQVFPRKQFRKRDCHRLLRANPIQSFCVLPSCNRACQLRKYIAACVIPSFYDSSGGHRDGESQHASRANRRLIRWLCWLHVVARIVPSLSLPVYYWRASRAIFYSLHRLCLVVLDLQDHRWMSLPVLVSPISSSTL